jgi:hypothetical protein
MDAGHNKGAAGGSCGDAMKANSCAPPPAELTAWWTMDDAATGSVSDLMGNVWPAGQLINNPLVVPGEVFSALKFNGVNQYVEVGVVPYFSPLDIPAAASNGSGDFSIDAWVKLDPGPNNAVPRW